MPESLIWNTAGSSNDDLNLELNHPMSSPASTSASYKSVLEQLDQNAISLVSSLNNSNMNMIPGGNHGLRRKSNFSANDGSISDMDSDPFGNNPFGFKKGTLSAISAPLGHTYNTSSSTNSRLHQNVFGSTSISGGIVNKHMYPSTVSSNGGSGGFLEKFSSVAEATRELEFSNNFKTLSINENTTSKRRTSFLDSNSPFLKESLSSPGSLNENLNTVTSRHQSISDKIDSYNSPNQSSAILSLSGDMDNGNVQPSVHSNSHSHSNPHPSTIWNPAAATSFTPSSNYYSAPVAGANNMMEQFPAMFPPNVYGFQFNGLPPMNSISPPPFMIPSPPPMIDPSLIGMNQPQPMSKQSSSGGSREGGDEDEVSEDLKEELSNEESQDKRINTANIGLLRNQNMPFMFPPFNPYAMYGGPPPMNFDMIPPQPSPPQSTPSNSTNNHTSNNAGNGNSNGNGNGERKKRSNSPNGNFKKNHIYRSPLLETIRNDKNVTSSYHLKDIYGYAIEFSKDQYGSRFIQQKLSSASMEEKEVIFNEIRNIAPDLMNDVFGNYVIQKFFEYGNTTQRLILLGLMKTHIHELSLQMYGCRVIQRALETVDLENQKTILDELKHDFLNLIKDQNGNHVIQKIIERLPVSEINGIVESVNDQIYHLATHPYGCRVIQRLLEYSSPDNQQFILDELNRFIYYLIQDQYGNYVIQHIIENGDSETRSNILTIVLDSQVVNFSKHKFASNVVEKCIVFGTPKERTLILGQVLLDNTKESDVVDDNSNLALMMKDQFANYVVQKLVDVLGKEDKKFLIGKIKLYLKQISNKNFGKHLASIEKLILLSETALDD